MSDAIDRAREALAGWDRSRLPAEAEWAAIVRDLLAVLAPGVLTESERAEVDRARDHYAKGSRAHDIIAILDRLCPAPAPAIKPGSRVWWWRDRNEECPHAEEGSGTYEKANPRGGGWYPHAVSVSNCIRDFGVDRVEPLRTDGGTE